MIIALGIIALALGVGGVYAYFAATVTQDTTSNVSISAVSGLAISFSNSANIEMTNVLPGQSWTKTFSATLTNNTSEIPIVYSVKLHITTNTFQSGEGYLTYTLTGAENKSETQITEQGGDITILPNKTIKGSKNTNEVVHSYTLTISYPNNPNSVQTQGGEFNGYVYFETGSNHISAIRLSNHEGAQSKTKENLEIGDLVTIGTEQFYVIGNADGSITDTNGKVRALAKYKLLVGRVCTSGSNDDCSDADKAEVLGTYGTYGLQSSQAKGSGQTPRVGTTEFSNTEHHGTTNTTYEKSQAEYYVNSYITKLRNEEGIPSLEGRLILKAEVQALKRYYTGDNTATIGGENMNNWTIQSGLTKPTWLWSTSYWVGSPGNTASVWGVHSDSYFYNYYNILYSYQYHFGVRPVIVF